MRYIAAIVSIFTIVTPMLSAETPGSQGSFACKEVEIKTVDSLFRLIPSGRISIDPARQAAKPAVLDRANAYLSLSFKDQSGNTITYTAALYTGGAQGGRIFLMVTRDMHYIAQMPFTEGFWIFEYLPGTCEDMTEAILPLRTGGGLIKLPRKGTDLVSCMLKGEPNGLREVCTSYVWNTSKATFIKKK